MAIKIAWLGDDLAFPDPATALREPNGLLAAGGDLSIERLLLAYRHGIFPWYSHGEPILWWSPDPRAVIFPGQLHISRSLKKTLHKKKFAVTFDQAFADVIEACSLPRPTQATTWLSSEMKQAYINLHHKGYAHSVECWHGNKLVGGIYGVVLGKCFFGESMFSSMTDASKVAMVELEKKLLAKDFRVLDCQLSSAHTKTMGAVEIPRCQFLQLLDDYAVSAV
jgi:leucyl/phenylalanyl-tRNA--protein transferase